MTIYGGIRINGEPVPELDPNRGQSIGLMVGGMLLLISGMIAFVTTQILRPTGDESGGTGSG